MIWPVRCLGRPFFWRLRFKSKASGHIAVVADNWGRAEARRLDSGPWRSAVGEGAVHFGAAEGPGKNQHRKGEKHDGEGEKDGQREEQGRKAGVAEKRGTHAVESVGYGIEMRDELQPVRENTHREEGAAGDAGDAQQKPFCRVAALEEQ